MTIPRKYPFEGQMLTVREVHELVPAYSLKRIDELLKRGMSTRQEMLCRPAKKAIKNKGWMSSNALMFKRSRA